jgi:integrase
MNRNRWPPSIGTDGRNPSEWVAGISGIGSKRYVEIKRAFQKALKIAEIEDFRFHDLRHCFASSLVQQGVDLYKVQRLLGHKDHRMTQRYAHLAPENLRDAVLMPDEKEKKISTNLAQ